MGRVLLIEPHATGHRGFYLSWMVQSLVEAGIPAVVATTDAAFAHASMEAHRLHPPESVAFLTHDDPRSSKRPSDKLSLARRDLQYWKAMREWHAHAKDRFSVDLAIIPYLDYCKASIALLGSPFRGTPWAGLHMRSSFHFGRMGIEKPPAHIKDLFERAVMMGVLSNKSLLRLWTLDPTLVQYFASSPLRPRLEHLPEVAKFTSRVERHDAKAALTLPRDRKHVLVFGLITARKGIAQLLQAAAESDFPNDVDIVLVGLHDAGVRELIGETLVSVPWLANRVVSIDEYVDSRTELLAYSAADAVWLGYSQHLHSSGVLAQAVELGIPIVAAQTGLAGWLTSHHDLGPVIDTADSGAVAAAVRKATSSTENYLLSKDPARQKLPVQNIESAKKRFSTCLQAWTDSDGAH